MTAKLLQCVTLITETHLMSDTNNDNYNFFILSLKVSFAQRTLGIRNSYTSDKEMQSYIVWAE